MIDPKTIRDRLPEDVRNARGTHAGLWLDKCIRNQSRDDTDSRRKLVEEVAELPEPPEYEACFKRWKEVLETNKVEIRQVRVKGRMAVGLGSESVLEASTCLHRTYGVPYIPGSALKGLTASYAHHYLGGEWRKGKKFHNVVFGTTDDAGYMTFFDALYIPGTGYQRRALAPDVITVHHKKYYQNAEAAPTDSDDPNPIPFLSTTGNYLLALAAPDLTHSTKWTDITFQMLAQALDKSGVGAKTSSGYGRIAFIDAPVKPPHPDVKKARGYKREIEMLRNVAGQLPNYHQYWRRLESEEARIILASAIVDKVHQARIEKVVAEKPWYKELQAFLFGKGTSNG
jgi:CRISPR-associated protein Cmr6